jgi:large subunit ribosomal protein L22
MGKRKKTAADERKEANKSRYFASLKNCPTSPQKMRYVADLIRGMEVFKALSVLKFNTRASSTKLEKVIASALNNYEQKTGQKPDADTLVVKEVFVDSGFQLKRLRTAPQGRAYRIKKRSNHVTVILDKK